MSHPAELSGHAVWIRLLQARFAKLAFAGSACCTEQPRGEEGRWGRGLNVVAQVPGRRRLAPQVHTIVASGSGCDASAHLLSSTLPNPIMSNRTHTRPTHPSSLANSPIKMYYYRTHILPSLNHSPLNEQEFLFSKAGNTSPLRHLAQKQWSPAKKGGKSENKNS